MLHFAVVLVMGTFAVAPSAKSAMISMSSTFGVDTVTRDTVTGVEWLDLTLSVNLSHKEVVAMLGPGGAFDGYRPATMQEVRTFWSNAGITSIDGGYTVDNYDPVRALQALIGTTDPDTVVMHRTLGMVSDTYDNRGGIRGAYIQTREPFLDAEGATDDGRDPALAYSFIGHWLVRPVPEPNALAMLTLGAIILCWRLHLSYHLQATISRRSPSSMVGGSYATDYCSIGPGPFCLPATRCPERSALHLRSDVLSG